MKEESKLKKRIAQIIIVLAIVLFIGSHYVSTTFYNMTFEEIVFNTTTKVKSANFSVVWEALVAELWLIILVPFLVYLPYNLPKWTKHDLTYKDSKNNKHILFKNHLLLYAIILLILSSYYSYRSLKIDKYLNNKQEKSSFIEENYINPSSTNITFSNKKNLIYIYVESLETSYTLASDGGTKDTNYIPSLTLLAYNNTNFSNTAKLGGALGLDTTGWTTAGIIAATAGVPLKPNFGVTTNYRFSNITTLGDILYANGYTNEFMMGSDGDFGARKEYLEAHHYQVSDLYTAYNQKRLKDGYHVWWGYEDSKLYAFAQEDITSLSLAKEPFSFTMLTADSHFIDGYLENSCDKKYNNSYANAIACSDSELGSFIAWIMQQDFYPNTTIVISGDHLTMQANFFNDNENSKRTIYNTFINSSITTTNNKNRLFTTMDMFPTTLASIGANIDGNQLGLGINLYSSKETLTEQYGINYINSELNKKSLYYDRYIIGG